MNTTELRRRAGDPERRHRQRVPELLRAARHGRRPQDEVPVHRGDRPLRGHRSTASPSTATATASSTTRRSSSRPASPNGRRPPDEFLADLQADQGQGPGRGPAVHELRGRLADVAVAAVHRDRRRATPTSPPSRPTTHPRGTRARASTSSTSCCTTSSRRASTRRTRRRRTGSRPSSWSPTGKIGVMALGSWAISQMQGVAKTAGADPANIGYMPFPNQIDGKFQSTTGGDLRLAINKNTQCMDAAKAWVSFFIDESGYAANENGIPTSLTGAAAGLVQGLRGRPASTCSPRTPRRPARKGLRDNIANEAEIDLWGNVYRQAHRRRRPRPDQQGHGQDLRGPQHHVGRRPRPPSAAEASSRRSPRSFPSVI